MLNLQRHRSHTVAMLLLAAAAWPAAAAPDEAAYGAASAYSHGDRSNWFRQDHLVGALTAMDQLFPVRQVPAGPDVRPLPQRAMPAGWTFVQRYLDRHPATGLLVMKDGQVLVERYQYGRRAEDRFTSFSMAKTVVAMALGITRLGQLLLDGGQRDGKQVIPRAWIEAATTVRPQDTHLLPRRATPYLGYGYQTWNFPEGLGFALLGVRGQAVYVNPQLRLVMVQAAVWPTSSNLALGRERDQFWRDLIRAAAQERTGAPGSVRWRVRPFVREKLSLSAGRSVNRSDERAPSPKVFRLRRAVRWSAQFLPVIRRKLVPERLIISDSVPVNTNREIVLNM